MPVAQRILVFGRKLGKGLFMSFGNEYAVVSEASVSYLLFRYISGAFSSCHQFAPVGIYHSDDGDKTATVLNEVSARSGSFRICEFEVYSESYLVGRYRADGVLFSTPSGSTAYALSAGGPVIEPDLECIEMTLICPHSLFSRATMFSPQRKLIMKDVTVRDDSMVINVDGELFVSLRNGDSIEICRGKNNINFINLIGNSFHESLCKKMCKPIK